MHDKLVEFFILLSYEVTCGLFAWEGVFKELVYMVNWDEFEIVDHVLDFGIMKGLGYLAGH